MIYIALAMLASAIGNVITIHFVVYRLMCKLSTARIA